MGALGRGLVKLEVAVTDVRAGGETCLSEASCSPSALLLIRGRNFLVSLIPWNEARSHPPSPQNTFLK